MNTNRSMLMLAGLASGIAVTFAGAALGLSRREYRARLEMRKAVDEATDLLVSQFDRKRAQQDEALETLRLMIVRTDELLGRVLDQLEATHQ